MSLRSVRAVIVVVFSLLPVAALACQSVWPASWSKPYRGGELRVEVPKDWHWEDTGAFKLEYVYRGRVEWSVPLESFHGPSDVHVSPDERYLALVQWRYETVVRVFESDGWHVADWNYLEALTPAERSSPLTPSCGRWLGGLEFQGDVLAITVNTGRGVQVEYNVKTREGRRVSP